MRLAQIRDASGPTFAMELRLSNLDSVNHLMKSLIAAPPFRATQYVQGGGHQVTTSSDEWFVTAGVLAPTVSSSFTSQLNLTMGPLSPG